MTILSAPLLSRFSRHAEAGMVRVFILRQADAGPLDDHVVEVEAHDVAVAGRQLVMR